MGPAYRSEFIQWTLGDEWAAVREKAGKVEVADFLTVEEESDLRVCFALCYTWWRERSERRKEGPKGQNEDEADAGECIKMVKNYGFIPKQPGVN